MLPRALAFLLVALVAGLLGFGGMTSGAAGIAQVLSVIFTVLFVASLLRHVIDHPRPPRVP